MHSEVYAKFRRRSFGFIKTKNNNKKIKMTRLEHFFFKVRSSIIKNYWQSFLCVGFLMFVTGYWPLMSKFSVKFDIWKCEPVSCQNPRFKSILFFELSLKIQYAPHSLILLWYIKVTKLPLKVWNSLHSTYCSI